MVGRTGFGALPIQRVGELEEILALDSHPPTMDDGMWAVIEQDRAALAHNFYRGCGYCLPCPADIPAPMAARMSLLLRRLPPERFLTDKWKDKMKLIDQCTECEECKQRCPYNLDVPVLLKEMLADYRQFYSDHK